VLPARSNRKVRIHLPETHALLRRRALCDAAYLVREHSLCGTTLKPVARSDSAGAGVACTRA
jgi:hypothetical protein